MKTNSTKITIEPAETYTLAQLVNYSEGAIVSRIITKQTSGTITLFAFDEGESLSEHTVPYDAFVYILEGNAEFVIDNTPVAVSIGECILLPANIPHTVLASQQLKMLLTMLKS